jgi:Uncharacterized protein conserved in bacteria (DUF2252)
MIADIATSTADYEAWLRKELRGEVVEDDLEEKHKKMAADAFQFLRATYWRWAETILTVCPELKGAASVLAVGDIHIENFGSWRDGEGRLVWGVNDFDEAAKMPYALDLVRLATSAVLAKVPGLTIGQICAHVLTGYRKGLLDPRPFVLDGDHRWLRRKVAVPEEERVKFWDKFDPDKNLKKTKRGRSKRRRIPPRHAKALQSAQPDDGIELVCWPRAAGTGSLGRARWVGYGLWRGAPIVRESKAIVPSAWTRAHKGSRRLRCEEIATGKYRSPDPWYELKGRILVRRLSPNDRKLELPSKEERAHRRYFRRPPEFVNPSLLRAMGHDLASIHRGTPNRKKAIMADLVRRKRGWLRAAVESAAMLVRREHKDWAKATR